MATSPEADDHRRDANRCRLAQKLFRLGEGTRGERPSRPRPARSALDADSQTVHSGNRRRLPSPDPERPRPRQPAALDQRRRAASRAPAFPVSLRTSRGRQALRSASNRAEIPASEMRRLLERTANVLDEFVSNPGKTLKDIDILFAAEREAISSTQPPRHHACRRFASRKTSPTSPSRTAPPSPSRAPTRAPR